MRDVLGVDMREPRERLVEFLDAFENVLEVSVVVFLVNCTALPTKIAYCIEDEI